MATSRRPASQSPATTLPDLSSVTSDATTGACDAEGRRALIEQTAYFLAEKRGFALGEELNDWLAAELEVDRQLRHAAPEAK